MFLLAYSFFLVGQLKAYENLRTLLFILDNTMYILGTVYSLVLLVAVWRVKYAFHNLLAKITDNRYFDESFFLDSDAQLKKLMRFTGPLIVIAYIGIIVYPILNAFTSNVNLGSPSTFIYLSWYPWKVNTVPKYTCTIFLQICSATMICSVVSCVIFFVIYCMVVTQCCGAALLNRMGRLETKGEDFENYVRVIANKKHTRLSYYEFSRRCRYLCEKHITREFRCTVEYHNFLIR